MSMSDTPYKQPQIFVRKDDPGETVKIVIQERHPNGRITFEWVTPKNWEGQSHTLPATEFYALFYDPEKDKEDSTPPARPHSFGSAKEWRRYALALEKRLGINKPIVYRQLSGVDAVKASLDGLRGGVLEPDSDHRPLGRGF